MRRARPSTPFRPSTLTRLATVGAVAAVGSAAFAIAATADPDEPVEAPAAAARSVTVSAEDVVDLGVERSDLADALQAALESRVELTATAPPEPEPEPEPAPEPDPTPEPEPEPEPATSGAIDGGVWDRLAQCESGGNWSINTGNGYYGGLQFNLDSWRWVGGSGYPHEASKAEQIHRAEILHSRQGWNAWPACSSKLGLR